MPSLPIKRELLSQRDSTLPETSPNCQETVDNFLRATREGAHFAVPNLTPGTSDVITDLLLLVPRLSARAPPCVYIHTSLIPMRLLAPALLLTRPPYY